MASMNLYVQIAVGTSGSGYGIGYWMWAAKRRGIGGQIYKGS